LDDYRFSGLVNCTSWGGNDQHYFSYMDTDGSLTLQWESYRFLDCKNLETRNAIKEQLRFCLKVITEMEKLEDDDART